MGELVWPRLRRWQSLGETFGVHEDFLLVAHAGLSVRRKEKFENLLLLSRGSSALGEGLREERSPVVLEYAAAGGGDCISCDLCM